MTTKPYENAGHTSSLEVGQGGWLDSERIVRDAEVIEDLLKKYFSLEAIDADAINALLDSHPTIKHLNSFGKQIAIRMFRSNSRFWGYKVDFNRHLLKSHILFLIGTLCDGFDYMNTSPLSGLSVLDVGCGALSAYSPPAADDDLLNQFYNDHPPLLAEMLQSLGAQVVGIDPRDSHPKIYDYQTSYKHVSMEFDDIERWLSDGSDRFDVIACFNLFSRQSFLYDHLTAQAMTKFFRVLRWGLRPGGLVYTSPPMLPRTPENRQINRQIVADAGFKILYEGYYLILQPL